MSRAVVAAAIAALAMTAPPATASHATTKCTFVVTGAGAYSGVAFGSTVSPTPGEPVSIRCLVLVNGEERSSTPTAANGPTWGPIQYTADHDDDVKWCTEWTAGAESGRYCEEARPVSLGSTSPPG